MTQILISAVMTEFSLMRAHWKRHEALRASGKIGTDKPIGRDVDLGGALALLDLDDPAQGWTLPLSCPSGIAFTAEKMFVASMRDNLIYTFDKEMIQSCVIEHGWFNDLHGASVDPSRSTVLVASSGVDSILEFDLGGGLLWSWTAYDHGFDLDQFGTKTSRPFSTDLRGTDYPTLHQSTHVNSVLADGDRILAVLFHQGQVVAIDRATGSWKTVISGLRQPHSLRRTRSGLSVCDTRGGRIVFTGPDFHQQRSMPVAVEWVADALELPDGRIVVTDGHAGRLLIIDQSGRQLGQVDIPSEWKLFATELVPSEWESLTVPPNAREGLVCMN